MTRLEVGKCAKYGLFVFNTIFMLTGLVLILISLWAWAEKGFVEQINEINAIPVDPVVILAIVGVITFILSISGCVGSLRENLCLLKFFAVTLGVVFFGSIIAGVLAIVYEDWTKMQFESFLNTTIVSYRDDVDLQNIIDFAQEYLQCCGAVLGPNDWDNNLYFKCNGTVEVNGIPFVLVESCGVPFSCCIKPEGQEILNTHCGYDVRSDSVDARDRANRINVASCAAKFEEWLAENILPLAATLITLAILQIFPICIAQNVISDIEAIKARWKEVGSGRSDAAVAIKRSTASWSERATTAFKKYVVTPYHSKINLVHPIVPRPPPSYTSQKQVMFPPPPSETLLPDYNSGSSHHQQRRITTDGYHEVQTSRCITPAENPAYVSSEEQETRHHTFQGNHPTPPVTLNFLQSLQQEKRHAFGSSSSSLYG